MSLGITKKCFPPANKCHNCIRKSREDIIEKSDERREFLRCSGCHLMTYCDKDCQREHWEKVHNAHCKFLSGRKPLQNSRHSEDTCTLCVDEKKTSKSDLRNSKSPKTDCHLNEMINAMKISFGLMFEFHEEGKTCNCSSEFSCELPFPLGELSGQYIGAGLDGMLAHGIKLSMAMDIKGSGETGETNGAASLLLHHLLVDRVVLWKSVLITGVPKFLDYSKQKNIAKELKRIYGYKNAWWKSLMKTVNDIANMNLNLLSEFIDTSSIAGPSFTNLKLIQDYNQSQFRNQVFVSENNLWSKFKLWPTWVDGSLVILLPEETRCHICNSSLTGEVTVTEDELIFTDAEGEVSIINDESAKARSMLWSKIGEHGELVACCSILKNPRCLIECKAKDVMSKARDNEETWKNYLGERKMFITKGRNCDLCLKMSLSSHRCSECKAAQYCSTQCQLKDLTFHKTVCSSWAKDKSRKIISAKTQKKISKSKADEYFK